MTSTEDTDLDPKAANLLRSRVGEYLDGTREGRGLRVGVVCGKFNGAITIRLLEGALDAPWTRCVRSRQHGDLEGARRPRE